MRYFGVPVCPYCKKRVNLIRTWSLKKQGEYCCPRCGGISNVYLSPLIYVFALLAVFSGGAMYFFHRYILGDLTFSTVLQVLLPFVLFYLISLFMVYLAKPVIKKVYRSPKEQVRRQDTQSQRPLYEEEDEDYLPPAVSVTGPVPRPVRQADADMRIFQSAVHDLPDEDVKIYPPVPVQGVRRSPEAAARVQPTNGQSAVSRQAVDGYAPLKPAQAETPQPAARAESTRARRLSIDEEVSLSNDAYFKRYDDPSYAARHMAPQESSKPDEN